MLTLPTIPADKALHFLYGAGAWLAAAIAATVLPLVPAAIAGLAAAAALGVAKEAWDHWRARTRGEARAVEWGDVIATAAGGVAMSVAGWLA